MTNRIRSLGFWVVLLGGSYAASRASGDSFALIAGMAVLAILFNGAMARIEDDSPGGFDNPDGTNTPAYLRRVAIAACPVGVFILLATVALVASTRP